MWIPEAKEDFRIVLPCELINGYMGDLYAFLMNPREEYLLGAVCLLRQLEGCIYDQTKQSLKQYFIAESFGNTKNELETCYGALSSMLHYQGFKGIDPASPETAEKEMEFLGNKGGQTASGRMLLEKCRFLTGFLMDLHQEEISGLEFLQRTHALLQLPNDGKIVKVSNFALKTEAGVLPRDRFISGLGRILFLLHTEICRGSKKEISRIQILSAAVAARLMAEKAGHILAWKNKPACQVTENASSGRQKLNVSGLVTGSIPENAVWELEDYLVFLKGLHGFKEKIEVYEGVSCMEDLQRECNRLIDYRWSESKKTEPKGSAQSIEKTVETELRKYTDEGGEREKIHRINVRAVMLSDIILEESLPVSLKKLREEYRADVHKLRKKCRLHQILNRILIPASALLVGVMVIVVFIFMPRTGLYSDYVYERGIPKGIQRITEKHPQTGHYRIVTQAGRFLSLEHLNAAGSLTDENQAVFPERPARLKMAFDNQSVLNAYNAAGDGLYQAVISENGRSVIFRHPDTGDELLLPYDCTKINVYTWAGQSSDIHINTASEIYALRGSNIVSGRPGVISFEQADERHVDGNGVERIQIVYDSLGRVQQLEYRYSDFGGDLFEQLLESKTQARALAEDRLIRKIYTYSDAHPWMASCREEYADGTYLLREYTYEGGECTEILLKGTSQKGLPEAQHGMRMHFAYEEGRMTSSWFTDLDGQLINGSEGYAKQTWVYQDGKMVRTCRYDVDDRLFTYGWAVLETGTDAQGTETTAYYDADGSSIQGENEWARMVSEKVQPVHTGWSARILTYYDANGAMMTQKCGARKALIETSPDGRTQVGYCLDADNALCTGSEGYAVWVTEKEGSLVLSRKYYGMHDELVNCREGYCQVEYQYNAKRQNTMTKYASVTGLLKSGYDKVIRQYQQQGRIEGIVSTLTIDGKDVPVINAEYGTAYVTYLYEEDSRKRVSYYNTEKKPMISPVAGCACIETVYDQQGRILEETYLNENGQLMWNEKKQMVLQRIAYDDPAWMKTVFQLLKTEQMAGDGPTWKKVQIDQRGRTACWIYLDDQMNPVDDIRSGIAGEIHNESDDGRTLTITYIDSHEKPVVRKEEGYASVRFEYDAVGNLSRWIYLDLNSRPIHSESWGYAGVAQEFDRENRLTAWTYLDASLNPMELPQEGYASVHREYDAYGGIAAEWFEDTEGELTVGASKKYAKATWDRNKEGNPYLVCFYSSDGSLTAPPQFGYAVEKTQYDSIGRIIRIEYYDASGNAAQNSEGQYGEERVYYDPAKPEQYNISFLNENGQSFLEQEGAEERIQGIMDTWYQFPLFYDFDGPIRQEGINWFDSETHEFDETIGAAGAKVVAESDGISAYPVTVEFVDSEGNPILNEVLGWAKEEMRMMVVDGYSYLSQTRYYDENGLLTIVPDIGAAGMDRVPLSGDRYSMQTYIGTDGLPMINELQGFCTVRYEYDGDTITTESYYDEKDQLMCSQMDGFARYVHEKKKENGFTEHTVSYYDEKGRLVNTKEGIPARSVYIAADDESYNEIRCYGPDEQLHIYPDFGFAKMIMKTSIQNNQTITVTEFYNEQEQLDVPVGFGINYAKSVTTQETKENLDEVTVTEYYGPNGVPIISNICDAFRKEDIRGLGKNEYRLYGLDGQLINNSDGIAIYRAESKPIFHFRIYNEDNAEIEHFSGWIQYGTDDNLMVAQKGTFTDAKPGSVFVHQTTLDSDSRPVKGEFLDGVYDYVINSEVGYASIDQVYNGDKLIHIAYTDEYGNPYVNPIAGSHGIKITWNGSGILSGLYYEYTDGTIMNNANSGFAYLQITENGEYMAFDAQGRPVRLLETGETIPIVIQDDETHIALDGKIVQQELVSGKICVLR